MKPGEIARNVSRGAFYIALEKAAAALSGFFYVALLMRWLGPTKYGIISLAFSFSGLATMATGNFEVFLERYVAEFQARGDRPSLRRSLTLVLALKLGLGVVASLVLLAIAPFLARQFRIPELAALLPVLTLMVAFDGFSTAGRATLFGLQRFRSMSVIAIVFHVVKTLMVGLLWFTRHGLMALAVGLSTLTVLQGIAMVVVPAWVLRRAPGEPADEARVPLLRPLLRYCLPLLGARVTFLSGQNLSKIVLGKLFDATQLGYFTFAFNTIERFVEMVYTLPSALLPSLTHLVARGERARLRDVFDQAHRLIQVVGGALAIGLFAFAHEITLLMGSRLFLPAVPMLRILALVPAARTAQQPLTMLFQALRRPGTVLGLAVVKFVAEFGSYFLLVIPIGIVGAAWANLVGAVVAYAAALLALAVLVPEGARARCRAALTSGALVLGMVGLVLAAGLLAYLPGLVARVLLMGLAFWLVGATGLVVRYDLAKLEALSIGNGALRRARTVALGLAQRWVRRAV